MIPNESDTEDLPDKEFKGMVINRFKQLKDVSILQEHRNKQLNQIKKSVQNMKIEFNKKRISKAKSQGNDGNNSLHQPNTKLNGQPPQKN